MRARQTTATIIYDGVNVTEYLEPYLKSLRYTDELSGKADSLDIVLEDKDGRWLNSWLPDKGAAITVSLTETESDTVSTTLSLGTFEIDEISVSGYPQEARIRGVSVPSSTSLRGTNISRSWENTTLQTIANNIAADAGLQLYYTADSVEIARAEQSEQSGLSFLASLCKEYGLALKVYNTRIVIFDEVALEGEDAVRVLVKPGTTYTAESGKTYLTKLLDFRISSKLRDTYDSCHVKYQDIVSKSTIEATYTATSGDKVLEVNEYVNTQADADNLAKKRLRETNKHEVQFEATLQGGADLCAGSVILAKGFGLFDGTYIIDQAQHTLSGGYTVSLHMRRCLDGY